MKHAIDTAAIEDGLFTIAGIQNILWTMSKAVEHDASAISWQTLYFLSEQLEKAQKDIDAGARLYAYSSPPKGGDATSFVKMAPH